MAGAFAIRRGGYKIDILLLYSSLLYTTHSSEHIPVFTLRLYSLYTDTSKTYFYYVGLVCLVLSKLSYAVSGVSKNYWASFSSITLSTCLDSSYRPKYIVYTYVAYILRIIPNMAVLTHVFQHLNYEWEEFPIKLLCHFNFNLYLKNFLKSLFDKQLKNLKQFAAVGESNLRSYYFL